MKKLLSIFILLSVICSFCIIDVSASEKSLDTSYIDYVEEQAGISAVDDYTDRVLIVVYDENNDIQSYNLIYTKSSLCYWSGTYINSRNQGYRYQLNSDFSVYKLFTGNLSNASVSSSRVIVYSDFDIYDKDGNLFYSSEDNLIIPDHSGTVELSKDVNTTLYMIYSILFLFAGLFIIFKVRQ